MLKGIRCETAKCPMERQGRNTPPGRTTWVRRSKGSNYAIRLREKQKVKRYYGMYESQFMRYFRIAERAKGNTGEALLSLLERRLDNVVCKLGFASSRKSARIMIGHGHVHLNGRKVDRPSYLVKQGDRISVKPTDKSKKYVKASFELGGAPQLQPWLQFDENKLEGTVAALPTRDDVQIPVEEQLIVEMCSR